MGSARILLPVHTAPCTLSGEVYHPPSHLPLPRNLITTPQAGLCLVPLASCTIQPGDDVPNDTATPIAPAQLCSGSKAGAKCWGTGSAGPADTPSLPLPALLQTYYQK